MKISKAVLQQLIVLRSGETVPVSKLPEDWAHALRSEGGAATIVNGSRQALKIVAPGSFDAFLRSQSLRPKRLEETLEALSQPQSRAVQVQLTGDSKTTLTRSCPGFPVNVTRPLSVRLGERKILLCNCAGTFLYISDFLNFRIPSDVTVIGVENMENFRLIERHGDLFEELESRLLFVSRYPQSKDLITWLQGIPNSYVHFGDFDLAGLHIYQNEFFAHLGPERASFFVPEDLEERLQTSGSRERYATQFAHFGKMEIKDPRLLPLVSLIHQYQKGYDQEGYLTPTEPE